MRTAPAESDKGICLIELMNFTEGRCSARCLEEQCSAWRPLPEGARSETGGAGRCALLGGETSLPRESAAGG